MKSKVYIYFVVILLFSCFWSSSCASGKPDNSLSAYTLAEERPAGSRIITSTVAGRDVTIYLPAGHDSAQKHGLKRFPTVYFYDGQIAFSAMNIAVLLDEYIAAKRVEPMIVVGVHSSVARTSETVPYTDAWITANWGTYSPNARAFAETLRDLVIPQIDKQFFTDATPEKRAIMGFSLGGLFAAWCGLNFRDTFGSAVAFSPSFWVADEKFFEEAKASIQAPRSLRFDVGATTGEWNYYVPLIGILKEKGMKYGENLSYYEDPKGRHDAASWLERLPDALLWANRSFRPIPLQDSITAWRVETEVIQSASTPGRFFLRLNPIVTTQSSLRYSLATEAAYMLLNPNDGALASDGRFQFAGTNDLHVKIRYKHLSTQVIINYADVQRRMGR
jgi:enterochelin esterase-like enzyme